MKKILSLLLLCCILLTGCGKTDESTSKAKYLEEGKISAANEEYDKALKFFNLALEEDSNDTEVNALYNQCKNLVEAIDSMENKNYTVAIQICEIIEKMKSESNIIKEAASDLKEEWISLLNSNEKEEETVEEEKKEDVEENTTETENTDYTENNPLKNYHLNKMTTLEKKYENAYDNLVENSEIENKLNEEYNEYDKELNEIWADLQKQLPSNEMKTLAIKEKDWVKEKEATSQDMAAQSNSSASKDSVLYLVNTTKERCYYLIDYLR